MRSIYLVVCSLAFGAAGCGGDEKDDGGGESGPCAAVDYLESAGEPRFTQVVKDASSDEICPDVTPEQLNSAGPSNADNPNETCTEEESDAGDKCAFQAECTETDENGTTTTTGITMNASADGKFSGRLEVTVAGGGGTVACAYAVAGSVPLKK